jgi:hypothetical protein
MGHSIPIKCLDNTYQLKKYIIRLHVHTDHNGVAERKNRHLLEVARSMMISMNVPK